MDGDDFEEVFVVGHVFFEGGVSGPGGDILGRGGFGAECGGEWRRSGGGGGEFEVLEDVGCH